MGEAATRKPREPMDVLSRYRLWFAAIIAMSVVAVVGIILSGVIAYHAVMTPEKMCAGWRDPPEFCRELAKRKGREG